MRLRGWTSVCLLSFGASACRRERADVRVPLGARVAGLSHPSLAHGVSPARAAATVAASLPAASYSADQAARGAQTFASTCARCHPPGQLDGPPFAIAWNEARVSTLFTTVRNTMPQDKPGSLTDSQYVDVIAYLLQRGRAPAGATPLPPDSATLHGLRIAVAP